MPDSRDSEGAADHMVSGLTAEDKKRKLSAQKAGRWQKGSSFHPAPLTYLDKLLAEGVESVVILKGNDEVGGGLSQRGVLQVHRQLEGGPDTLHLVQQNSLNRAQYHTPGTTKQLKQGPVPHTWYNKTA